jgi:hypothetical protein
MKKSFFHVEINDLFIFQILSNFCTLNILN